MRKVQPIIWPCCDCQAAFVVLGPGLETPKGQKCLCMRVCVMVPAGPTYLSMFGVCDGIEDRKPLVHAVH